MLRKGSYRQTDVRMKQGILGAERILEEGWDPAEKWDKKEGDFCKFSSRGRPPTGMSLSPALQP